jgi:hypothetical protein
MSQPPLELSPSPAPLPSYWRQFVNEPQTAVEIQEIRTCVNRQRPFGTEEWVTKQASLMGAEQSLAPVGRPRKSRRVPVC